MRTVLALALTLVGCTANAQVTPTKAGYLFRAGHTVGKGYRYLVSMARGTDMVSTTDDVKTARMSHGIATVVVKVSPATTGVGKSRRVVGLPKQNSVQLDSQNQARGRNGLPLVMAQFPKAPVKIGGVWTGISSFPTGNGGGGTLATTYHLASVKQDRGRSIAVLDVLLRGFAQGSGAMLVDMSDGSVLASSLTLQMTLPNGDSDQVQITTKRQG